MRVGLGFDLHRIRKHSRGYLKAAGVRIPAPYVIEAHSDGDLIFHALSDAVASAAGADDIGAAFPPGKAKTKNLDSKKILNWALNLAVKKSCSVHSVSLVLAAERPKLGPQREKIRGALASALGIAPDRVGLSFKTFEGMSPFAEGALACWATCLLEEK